MRAFMILVVLVVVVAAVVGYERGWFVVSSAANDDNSTEVNIRVNKDQWRKDQDEFHTQADAQLKEMGRQLDELKAKASKADAASRDKLNETVDSLNKKYQAAKEELKSLGNSAQEHWETSKTKLGHALDDLKQGVDKAASHFR